jgi:hypothetical protein
MPPLLRSWLLQVAVELHVLRHCTTFFSGGFDAASTCRCSSAAATAAISFVEASEKFEVSMSVATSAK